VRWTRPGDKIVGVTTDGNANMTGSDRGAVSHIERETFQGLYRSWCGLHQLDIFVQRAVSKLYDDKFYGQLTALIATSAGSKYLHKKWPRNAQRLQIRAVVSGQSERVACHEDLHNN
jgi:hypothetical protein